MRQAFLSLSSPKRTDPGQHGDNLETNPANPGRAPHDRQAGANR